MWGALTSAAKGLVTGAEKTPFKILDLDFVKPGDTSIWKMQQGIHSATGESVTVFSLVFAEVSEEQAAAARNGVRRSKMLRHPNFVRYVDTFETPTHIYLLTEPVTPLSESVKSKRNDLAVSWGIHQIGHALEFLVERSMSHSNICISSVFLDRAGEWKLGGLELLQADDDSVDSRIQLTTPIKYQPPEVSQGRRGHVWSADMWGLGCLVWEVYNGELTRPEKLKEVGAIPKKLLGPFVKLIGANPKSRPSPKQFLSEARAPGKYLQNSFVDSNLFLDELAIKDSEEKAVFYKNLPSQLDQFPEEFCVHKYLPSLLQAFNFGGAGSEVLAPLFKIGKMLDDIEYTKQVVPCVVKLFSSVDLLFAYTDRATRISLLQQLEQFAEFLSCEVVSNKIFPHVVSGFSDTVPAMREQTVKAMLLLAGKLSDDILDNQLLKHFAKCQTDEQPGIRTNTTICLGKIAKHLSAPTRDRVLISAFLRATKDPFVHARNAGIMALTATQEYYSRIDIATKILPAIVPLTVDPEELVRKSAMFLIKTFLETVEKANKDIKPAQSANATHGGDSTVDGPESESTSSGTGWAGGLLSAASTLSNAYSKAQGASLKDSKNNSVREATQSAKRAEATKKSPSPRASNPKAINDNRKNNNIDEGDGWGSSGDGDGWGNDDRNSGDGWTGGSDDASDYGDDALNVGAPVKSKMVKQVPRNAKPSKVSTGPNEATCVAENGWDDGADGDWDNNGDDGRSSSVAENSAVSSPEEAKRIAREERKLAAARKREAAAATFQPNSNSVSAQLEANKTVSQPEKGKKLGGMKLGTKKTSGLGATKKGD